MVLRALFLRVSKPVFAKTRLSSDNGAEMRLVDADDAVGAAADILLEHHLLLLVHLECCLQALVILAAETRKKTARLFAQKIEKYLCISPYHLQYLSKMISNQAILIDSIQYLNHGTIPLRMITHLKPYHIETTEITLAVSLINISIFKFRKLIKYNVTT